MCQSVTQNGRRHDRTDPALAVGVNTVAGQVTNAPVADFLHLAAVDPVAAFA